MKHAPPKIKALLVSLLLWMILVRVDAQTSVGIKGGLSLPSIAPTNILVSNNGVNYYEIKVEDERYGIHAGIFMQVQMGHFFIEPELIYNSYSIGYGVDSLSSPGLGTAHVVETYRYINTPVMFGFKAGAIRIGAGPVGHIFISEESGFVGYEGYVPDFQKFTWGWQGGFGFDFWKLHFDFRYEKNYSQLGDHLTFFGQPYDFATDNNRVIGSVGLSF